MTEPAKDDLVERCQELLDRSRTGLLNGGKGGAVRALADRLRETVGETYALNVAESQTKDEAMREVVRLATLRATESALASARKALGAFLKAYRAQDSVTRGLDDAADLACTALQSDGEKE